MEEILEKTVVCTVATVLDIDSATTSMVPVLVDVRKVIKDKCASKVYFEMKIRQL